MRLANFFLPLFATKPPAFSAHGEQKGQKEHGMSTIFLFKLFCQFYFLKSLKHGSYYIRYSRSKSGWFDATTFEEWFFSLALPELKKKNGTRVLMGDNLSSHLSLKVIKACRENSIKFICLPPNSTDYLQPLDVAFFGPLKREWRKILNDYKNDHANESAVRKDRFPQLLKLLWNNVILKNGAENLRNGFEKCLSRERILAGK